MIKNITYLGDAALYCDFGSEISKQVNQNVIKYFYELSKKIESKEIEGILNLTPSYNKLIIGIDLEKTNYKTIKEKVLDLNVSNLINQNTKKIEIPICTEEGVSLDFQRLENITKKNKNEILKSFFNKDYYCYMTGFIAGMPFLGDLDISIQCNRLGTPRLRVPKGAVGITEQFANIYTFPSPGGWNIIGQTPLKIFDKENKESPNFINPGDTIVFYQISKKEFENWK
jgi:inhibitor of KinA